MTFEQELDVYLRARFTLLVLVTSEEERALQMIKRVCEQSRRPCLTWDVADGFQQLTGSGGALPSARDALSALEQVERLEGSSLVVLKDFHECWGHPQLKRKLRNVVQRLKYTQKSIVVTTPSAKLPQELKDEAVVVELPCPMPTNCNRCCNA